VHGPGGMAGHPNGVVERPVQHLWVTGRFAPWPRRARRCWPVCLIRRLLAEPPATEKRLIELSVAWLGQTGGLARMAAAARLFVITWDPLAGRLSGLRAWRARASLFRGQRGQGIDCNVESSGQVASSRTPPMSSAAALIVSSTM
jgi:hypothetical protein